MRGFFVDDEPNILDGLRRILRPLKNKNTVNQSVKGAFKFSNTESKCDSIAE